MFAGIDFGTSNSSAAVYNGSEIVFIPLDPHNAEDVHVLSSMLYIAGTGHRLFGRQAITAYINQMAGRTVKFERKHYGDLDMEFADMTYTAQGFYMEETDLPGRLFQYLKKYLGADFTTNVFGVQYQPYELAAMILKYIRTTIEAHLQREVDGVVLGRPVRFSDDDEKHQQAERNLLRACHDAGFMQVEFQFEPVAAAFNYSLTAEREERILIFDFGGGTFDVTIVNVRDQQSRVLGLGGVPVGGSDFDKLIMYQQIAPHFGKGAKVGNGWVVHDNMYLDLLNWQTIANLNKDRRFLRNLDNWLFYADDPRPFQALRRLVKENHGFAIFQEIEQAKKALTTQLETLIRYDAQEVFRGEGAIDIQHTITRREFEDLLLTYSDRVVASVDEALRSAGLAAPQIDRVIRVGGSSKIPFFHDLLAQKFGADKLLMRDEFKNVAAGLVEAYQQH